MLTNDTLIRLALTVGPLLLLLLVSWLVWARRQRREAARCWAQLGSVYNSQERRGRGESRK